MLETVLAKHVQVDINFLDLGTYLLIVKVEYLYVHATLTNGYLTVVEIYYMLGICRYRRGIAGDEYLLVTLSNTDGKRR